MDTIWTQSIKKDLRSDSAWLKGLLKEDGLRSLMAIFGALPRLRCVAQIAFAICRTEALHLPPEGATTTR